MLQKKTSRFLTQTDFAQKHNLKNRVLEFHSGILHFVTRFLATGIRDDIQAMCSRGGSHAHLRADFPFATYMRLLIKAVLDWPFADTSVYASVRDMPLKEKLLVLRCLEREIGMHDSNFTLTAYALKKQLV